MAEWFWAGAHLGIGLIGLLLVLALAAAVVYGLICAVACVAYAVQEWLAGRRRVRRSRPGVTEGGA